MFTMTAKQHPASISVCFALNALKPLKVLPEVAVVFAGCSCTDTRTYKQKGSPTQYNFFLPSVLQTQLRPATATSGSTLTYAYDVIPTLRQGRGEASGVLR